MAGMKAKSRRKAAGEEVNLAITVREAHGAIRAVADPTVEIALEILHHKSVTPVAMIAVAIEAAVTRQIDEFFAHRTCRTIIIIGAGIFQVGASMMNRMRCAVPGMGWPGFFRQRRTGEQNRKTCTGNHHIETEIHGPLPFHTRRVRDRHAVPIWYNPPGAKGGKVRMKSMVNDAPVRARPALAAGPAIS